MQAPTATLVFVLVAVNTFCDGLKCYECTIVEAKIWGFTFSPTKNCESPTSETSVTTCPKDENTYSCAFVTVKGSAGKAGARFCMQVDKSSVVGTCGKVNEEQASTLHKIIGDDLSSDSTLCLCNSDLCDNSQCNGWWLRQVCIPKWAPYVATGAAALLIFLIVVCCSCCRHK